MGVWVYIDDEDHFYLLRSTLERSMDKRVGLMSDDMTQMYEGILGALRLATKDVPERPLQEEVGAFAPPKPRKSRGPKSTVTKIVHCNTHKTYGAQRRPRTDCDTCWKAYERLHGANPVAKAIVSRKSKK